MAATYIDGSEIQEAGVRALLSAIEKPRNAHRCRVVLGSLWVVLTLGSTRMAVYQFLCLFLGAAARSQASSPQRAYEQLRTIIIWHFPYKFIKTSEPPILDRYGVSNQLLRRTYAKIDYLANCWENHGELLGKPWQIINYDYWANQINYLEQPYNYLTKYCRIDSARSMSLSIANMTQTWQVLSTPWGHFELMLSSTTTSFMLHSKVASVTCWKLVPSLPVRIAPLVKLSDTNHYHRVLSR